MIGQVNSFTILTIQIKFYAVPMIFEKTSPEIQVFKNNFTVSISSDAFKMTINKIYLNLKQFWEVYNM